MFVGAKGIGAEGSIAVDDHRVWMAKAIVALHRKHGDSWVDDAYKGRATGGQAAMMGLVSLKNHVPQVVDLAHLVALAARVKSARA